MRHGETAICVCGKLCTSKPGLTLHQRVCDIARVAASKGESTLSTSSIVESEMNYIKPVQEMVELMKKCALDAHLALTSKNKSAGRRARTALIEIRDKVTPLRKQILSSMRK